MRNMLKQKAYFVINILGLSIGMASCLLIFMYLHDEFSHDRHHKKGDRIYRVCRKYKVSNAEGISGTTTPPVARALSNDFADIAHVTRLSSWKFENVVRYGDKSFFEKRFIAADSSIFDVFTIPFESGNSRKALVQPYSMVISRGMA